MHMHGTCTTSGVSEFLHKVGLNWSLLRRWLQISTLHDLTTLVIGEVWRSWPAEGIKITTGKFRND